MQEERVRFEDETRRHYEELLRESDEHRRREFAARQRQAELEQKCQARARELPPYGALLLLRSAAIPSGACVDWSRSPNASCSLLPLCLPASAGCGAQTEAAQRELERREAERQAAFEQEVRTKYDALAEAANKKWAAQVGQASGSEGKAGQGGRYAPALQAACARAQENKRAFPPSARGCLMGRVKSRGARSCVSVLRRA